jgi:hypothetical protein
MFKLYIAAKLAYEVIYGELLALNSYFSNSEADAALVVAIFNACNCCIYTT